MRSGKRLGPLLVAWLMWLVIAAGALQEGVQLSLRLYLHSLIGGWPQVTVSLLRLKVASPRGEGEWRGLRVAWEGAEVRFSGRLQFDKVVVGPALAPILSARDGKIGGLWSLATGRIGSVALSPFNPEWRHLASGKKAGGDWIVNLPANLDLPSLTVLTPIGSWQGDAALWGRESGRAGDWCLALRDEAGTKMALQGRWDPQGGRGDGVLSSSDGTEVLGDLRWTPQEFRLSADFRRGPQRWMADAVGKRGGETQIFLSRGGSVGEGKAVTIRLATAEVNGEDRTIVTELRGEIGLPNFQLARGYGLLDLSLLMDSSETSRRGRIGASCVMAVARGKATTPLGELDLRGEFQLLDPTLPSRLLLVSLQGGRAGAAIPEMALDFRTRQDARGATRVRGSLSGWGSDLSFSAKELKGEWSAKGSVRTPSGDASLDLNWGERGWKARGVGTISEAAPRFSFPTPRGPLNVDFWAEGASSTITRAELNGSGAGTWSASLSKGKLSVDASNGLLSGDEFDASGVDLKGEMSVALFSGGAGSWKANLSARSLSLGGKRFQAVEVRGSGSAKSGEADLKAVLPFLDGEARCRATYGTGREREINIERGSLSLFKGDIVCEGLEGQIPWPKIDGGTWHCPDARFFGEELKGLKGTLKENPSTSRIILSGQGEHWEGKMNAEVGLGGDAPPELELTAKGLRADKVLPFVDRWVKLPLTVSEGKVGGRISLDLEAPAEGLKVALDLDDVTIGLAGGNQTLRKISGPLHGELAKGVFKVEDTKWTLEGGQVSVSVGISASADKTTVTFSTPEMPLTQLQNALFDFLPEYIGYGSTQGEVSLAGSLTEEKGAGDLIGTIELKNATFLSEDKTLKIKNANGSLPLHLSVGEAPQAVVGFQSLQGANLDRVFESMGAAGKGRALKIERIRYSVFTLDAVNVLSWLQGGNQLFRITGSSLWGGELRGEVGLALSTTNPRYAGQALFRDLSLKAFCDQSGTLRDFISGTLHGSLTFGGEGLGLSKIRMLADLEVGAHSHEERIIARKFLVKMGGERIKSLLHSEYLPYDEASAKCGLDNGTLTFYEFKLYHEANPVKAVLRKDVSFEVRLPARNSVSIWQLINHIKALETGTVSTPGPPP